MEMLANEVPFLPSSSFDFPGGTIKEFKDGLLEWIPSLEAEILSQKELGAIIANVPDRNNLDFSNCRIIANEAGEMALEALEFTTPFFPRMGAYLEIMKWLRRERGISNAIENRFMFLHLKHIIAAR